MRNEQSEYNPLSRHHTFGTLIKFAFPTLFMMVFSGLYTVVDIMFVSRLVNTDALSSINIVTPVINIIVGLGAMLATGGSAIVARKLGEARDCEARKDFTLIIVIALFLGFLITFIGLLFLKPILYALGADNTLFSYSKDYLSLLLIFAPANMLQVIFSIFLVTAGNPKLGFTLTLSSGLTNALLDFILLGILHTGIGGAALATGMGYLIQTTGGIIFFMRNRNGALHFVRPHFRIKVITESLFNGLSEMAGHLSSAATTFLFNITMIKLAGVDGVAAVTIIIYSQFLLSTFCIGFSMGVAPVFSYNYGNRNHEQMKRIFKICVVFIISVSALVFFMAMFGGKYLAVIFTRAGSNVYRITRKGFLIVPFAFLFSGLNIFSSALFTALSNGRVSAVISFLRSLVFLSIGILILPYFLGTNGLWLAIPFAEGFTFLIAITLLWNGREKYHYF